jgi:hypothetical protein
MGHLTTIDFHGATLLAQVGLTPDATLVAMRPVVDGMGLDWTAQYRKMLSHPVLAKGVAVIATPSDGGVQNSTALPLNRLSFWLATLHPDRIKNAEVRERVIRYQTECADALFAHFFGQTNYPASQDVDDGDGELSTPDGVKLRKVNTAIRAFGERAGAQLWVKLGLEWVPAMAEALAQSNMFDEPDPPGTITVKVKPNGSAH